LRKIWQEKGRCNTSRSNALKDADIEWHFIGRLQSNKVKYIIDKVELIHSLDRDSLLEEINKRAGRINKVQRVLLEVNVGEEETKGGVLLDDHTTL